MREKDMDTDERPESLTDEYAAANAMDRVI